MRHLEICLRTDLPTTGAYFSLVFLWCGRMVGRAYGHVITKFSRMGKLPHFLAMGLCPRVRELRYYSMH